MKKSRYKAMYEPVRLWFEKDRRRVTILKFFYKAVPLVIAAIYILIAAWLLLNADLRLAVFIGVPCAVFFIVSLIRKLFDRERPYEGENAVIPVIAKDKKGQSFPSRHALSAALIAAACIYINLYVGVAVFVLSLLVAVTRVLAGVHYPSDVIAGLSVGYIAGGIIFFLM
ncbi:MAG: phosphatase PAP2 family protein [Clostridia bacterium]|nr:phosphatase PAP2 family protein [Clostridia bacterium]